MTFSDSRQHINEREVSTTYGSRFAPDAIVAALVGLGLLLAGLIVIIRAGFSDPLAEPVIDFLGFNHTATTGLIEIAIGLCLLISGASRSRSGGMFFGAVLAVVGFVGAVQTDSFSKSLALESKLAWLAVIAGVVVVFAAMFLPRFAQSSTTTTQN